MSVSTDDRYFRTSSFYVAVFLYAKDQVLVNIDKTINPKRAQFVFVNSLELELLLHSFNYAKNDSPETLVDARKLMTAMKMLKDKLYQNEF